MEKRRTEIVDGKAVTIVEDTKEELHNFLDEAQAIDDLDKKSREKKILEVFGEEETEKEKPELSEEQQEAVDLRQAQMNEKQLSSRANSDVVLAMMLADKAASAIPANPCYVVHGAKVICSMGSREARLVVPEDHGTLLTGSPQMVVDDFISLENVKCFGNCFSIENPDMEKAAIETTNQYNVEKSKTTWGKIKGFFGVKPKKVDSVSDELKAACICECVPKLNKVWEDGNEQCRVDGKKTLAQTCILVCEYGGIIRIIDNGQEQ